MSNSYFVASGQPSTGAFAASAPMRTEFGSIEDGFDKLPALTAGTAVVVNGAGTALTNTVGTLALAGNFATTGAFSVTLAASAAVILTLPAADGTLATLAGTETFSNKTFGSNVALGTPVSGVATNLTGTAAGLTAGHVTTNADLTGPITSSGNATAVASQTGTGSTFVMQSSPTIPTLAVTTINKVTITTPAASAVLTIANGKTLAASASITLAGTDGKTLTVSNSITVAGTDATVMTFPGTSATIARTDAAQTFTGAQTFGTQQSSQGQIILANTVAHAYPATIQSSNSATAATTITLPPDAGSNAYYLQTNGSGATIWAPGTASFTLIESKTVAGTPSFVEFKNLTIEDGILYIAGLTVTAGTTTLRIEFSTDNGSSYFGTVYNLLNGVVNQTAMWAQFPINGLKIGLVTMPIYNSGSAFAAAGPPSNPTASAANAVGSFLSFGSSITAIRVSTSASTFVSGSVLALVGRA